MHKGVNCAAITGVTRTVLAAVCVVTLHHIQKSLLSLDKVGPPARLPWPSVLPSEPLPRCVELFTMLSHIESQINTCSCCQVRGNVRIRNCVHLLSPSSRCWACIWAQ